MLLVVMGRAVPPPPPHPPSIIIIRTTHHDVVFQQLVQVVTVHIIVIPINNILFIDIIVVAIGVWFNVKGIDRRRDAGGWGMRGGCAHNVENVSGRQKSLPFCCNATVFL
jgi:hypothetical protein